MPSASSGRYQSKLFNFFHSSSQRISSNVGQTWRKVKVATNWSLEALLYPVFLLIQKAVDSAGKQLNPQVETNQNQLNSQEDEDNSSSTNLLIADTPILNLLEMVRNLPSRQNTSNLSSTEEKINYVEYHQKTDINDAVKSYLPQVQGIATHLKNRHLVLVTSDNKILDILTLKQQQRLQDKIISEITEYCHSWRLLVEKNKTNLLPEINQLLNKLTASTDEVEIKPYLTKLDTVIAQIEVSTFFPISRTLNVIGQTLKQQLGKFIYGEETDSQALVPVARKTLRQQISQFVSSNQTYSPRQLPVVGQKIRQQLSKFIPNSEITKSNQTDLESQKLKVLDLIQQAIDYFFGFQSTPQLGGNQNIDTSVRRKLFSKPIKAALPQSEYVEETEDLWLTFDDLFGEEIEIETGVIEDSQKPNSKLLKEYQTGGNLVKGSSKNDSNLVSHQRITLPQPEKSGIGNQPDYIEISASTVSYEKHPIEMILEWLDLIILWLEERIANALRFLKRLFGT
jgi:hypothetical protein